MLQVDQIHNPHPTCLLIFLSTSWEQQNKANYVTPVSTTHRLQLSIYAHLRISTPSLSILSLQSYLNYCRNVLSMKKRWIHIKTKQMYAKIRVALPCEFASVHTMINWLFVFWLDNGIYTCIILVLRTLHSFTLQLNLHSTCSHRAWYNMYRHFNHSENWLSRQDIHVTTWELTESTRHTRNDMRTDWVDKTYT